MIARLTICTLGLVWLTAAAAQTCGTAPLQVQLLCSDHTTSNGQCAANSYLVWIDGRTRVLIDVGSGASRRFLEAGANAADLDVILLTSLQAEHTTDLPALLQLSLSQGRNRALPIYGPSGNKFSPSTVTFIRALFDGTRGAYRHLGVLLNPLARDAYKLNPQDVGKERSRLGSRRLSGAAFPQPFTNVRLSVASLYLARETSPVLAWRVDAGNKSVVFSRDTGSANGSLEQLAKGADLFVLQQPVTARESDRAPPLIAVEIAGLVEATGVKHVVLARAPRKPELEFVMDEASINNVAQSFAAADSLECFTP